MMDLLNVKRRIKDEEFILFQNSFEKDGSKDLIKDEKKVELIN